MRRGLIVAAVALVLMVLIGVDPLHCLLVVSIVVVVAFAITAVSSPFADPGDPEPLRVPYRPSVLRSLIVANARPADPVGIAAGDWVGTIHRQALVDHPDDEVLTRLGGADREYRAWTYAELNRLLDRLDRLDSGAARPGSRATSSNGAQPSNNKPSNNKPSNNKPSNDQPSRREATSR